MSVLQQLLHSGVENCLERSIDLYKMDSWMHKSWETKFYMVAPNVISIIIAVFYVKNVIINACTLSRTTRVRLTGNSRILCSECGTCFISPLWH